MKVCHPGIRCWWSMLLLSLTEAVPPGTRYTRDTQVPSPLVCTYQDVSYSSGQNITMANPCETCTCTPPQFTCSLKACEVKLGCKASHPAGHCCPEYVCDCQRNGRTYANGEKVEEPNPCNVCYCKGGEIKCAGVTCYTRDDCEPHYIAGRCCPKYDHCPPLDNNRKPDDATSEEEFQVQFSTLNQTTSDTQLVTNHKSATTVATLEIFEVHSVPSDRTIWPKLPHPFFELKSQTNVSDTADFRMGMLNETSTEPDLLFQNYSAISSVQIATITHQSQGTEGTEGTESTDSTGSSLTDNSIDNSTIIQETESTPSENPIIVHQSESTLDNSNITNRPESSTETTSVESFTQHLSFPEMFLSWLHSGAFQYAPKTLNETLLNTVALLSTQNITTNNPDNRLGLLNFLTALSSELFKIIKDKNMTEFAITTTPQPPTDEKTTTDDDMPPQMRDLLKDESIAPVLSMISDQLQFLKIGEEQPLYIENTHEENVRLHQGEVVAPTFPPITVDMVKVVGNTSTKLNVVDVR